MRYASATGNAPGGHQKPSSASPALAGAASAGAAFLRGSALGGSREAVSALDELAGDARLAAVFRQMRAIVGTSEIEMARRLGTNLTTVLDFEAGAVHALPPWPETVRIVDRYADLSQIDPSPILSRLLTLLPAGTPSQPTPIQPVGLRMAPNATGRANRQAISAALPVQQLARIESSAVKAQQIGDLPPGFDGRARERDVTARSARQQTGAAGTHDSAAAAGRRRRRIRRTLTLTVPIAAIAGVFLAMFMAPRPFYSLARSLPAPIDRPLRGMVDMAVAQTAPMRDGMRWIEMDDPRVRKGDRISAR